MEVQDGGCGCTPPRPSRRVVYFGSCDGYLYAVDTKTGRRNGSSRRAASVFSSPAISDGVVYFGSNPGTTAISTRWIPRRGRRNGSSRRAGLSLASHLGRNGLFGVEDGYLYAVDIKTGQEKWKIKTGDGTNSSPAVSEGWSISAVVTAISTRWTPRPARRNGSSTRVLWMRLPGRLGRDLYVGSQDGYLYAVDTKTGQEKWKFKTGGIASPPRPSRTGWSISAATDTYLYAVR